MGRAKGEKYPHTHTHTHTHTHNVMSLSDKCVRISKTDEGDRV